MAKQPNPDNEYLKNIYGILSKNIDDFSQKKSEKDFYRDMQKESYAQNVYGILSSNIGDFSNNLSEEAFFEKAGVKKKLWVHLLRFWKWKLQLQIQGTYILLKLKLL